MNKKRRKMISDIIIELESIKVKLNNVLSEEEMVFDNMPENLQGSMRGEESEEAIDMMSEADSALDDALGSLQEAIENLEEI